MSHTRSALVGVALWVIAVSAAQADDEFMPVNVRYMLGDYYYASSRGDRTGPSLLEPSFNDPKRLRKRHLGEEGKISLVALPAETVPFGEHYRGLRLLLINRTNREAHFSACDSRLSIEQQALTSNGEWKPIEYLPRSWCGNSYGNVTLPAEHYWEFSAAAYSGPMKTKLRFSLRLSNAETLYTESFAGSIHPEQFTERYSHNDKLDDSLNPYWKGIWNSAPTEALKKGAEDR